MTSAPRAPGRRARALLGAWILLAFALRAHRLAAQSLWSDEDITLDRVAQPLAALLAGLPVEHAPAYFVLMRAWSQLAGTSDLMLRAPSLFLGVLAVPLSWYVASRLSGARAGAVAAMIAALNPFLVWYGQEARMYAMVAALALATLAAVLRGQTGGGRGWWTAAGLLAALTVYTHYYGALIVPVLLAWAVTDLRRRGPRAATGWLVAGLAAALAFLPWLPRATGVAGFPGWREPVPLAQAPWLALSAWSAGATVTAELARPITWLYLLLAASGLVALGRRAWRGPARHGARGALLYALLPGVTAAAMVALQPDFHPRYFMAVVPAYYLLVACGAAALPRPAAVAAAALVAAAAAPPLVNLYTEPAYQKQDHRRVIRTVEETLASRGAALLLDGPPFGMMQRYRSDRRAVKIVNLRSNAWRHFADDALFAQIASRVLPYTDVWLAEDGGASGAGARWLQATERPVFPVEDRSVQHVRLRRYYLPDATPPTRTAPAVPRQTDGAPFGLVVTAPTRLAPGQVLPLELTWSGPADAARPAGRDGAAASLSVSLRLVGPDDAVAAAADRPVLYSAPAPAAGSATVERHGLLAPRNLAPGRYGLRIVLYDTATVQPVGTWHWPHEIRVEREPDEGR